MELEVYLSEIQQTLLPYAFPKFISILALYMIFTTYPFKQSSLANRTLRTKNNHFSDTLGQFSRCTTSTEPKLLSIIPYSPFLSLENIDYFQSKLPT